MNFVSLDFETATGYGSSACSIGIGVFAHGGLQQEYYHLIQPPLNEYLRQNIRIHGITPTMTENEPEFAALWPEICSLLTGQLVLAHCASFDMGVLRQTLDYHQLDHPNFSYACTCQLAKKIWPQLPSHSLGNMASYLGIKFQHHNALADAVACGLIALEAGRRHPSPDIESLLGAAKVKIKQFCP